MPLGVAGSETLCRVSRRNAASAARSTRTGVASGFCPATTVCTLPPASALHYPGISSPHPPLLHSRPIAFHPACVDLWLLGSREQGPPRGERVCPICKARPPIPLPSPPHMTWRVPPGRAPNSLGPLLAPFSLTRLRRGAGAPSDAGAAARQLSPAGAARALELDGHEAAAVTVLHLTRSSPARRPLQRLWSPGGCAVAERCARPSQSSGSR